MSNYDTMFGGSSTDSNQSSDDYTIRRWKIGSHAVPAYVDADDIRATAQDNKSIDADIAAALSTAADSVESVNITDYECPVCELGHTHGVNDGPGEGAKHDIRDEPIHVRDSFAEAMTYNPVCHCGVNELAMLLDFYPHMGVSVFEDDDRFAPLLNEGAAAVTQALEVASHPSVSLVGSSDPQPAPHVRLSVTEIRNIANGRATVTTDKRVAVDRIFEAFGIKETTAVAQAFAGLRKRFSHIRDAASQADIPQGTEADIERAREELEAKFR